MKNFSFLLFLFLSLTLIVPPSFAQPPSGNRPPGQRGAGNRGNFDISKLPEIGVLNGIVVDSLSGKPLEYATIKVQHMMADTIVTGGVTNAKGKFFIDKIKLGPQVVQVSFIGYETKTIRRVRLGRQGMEIDLGKITLTPANVILEQAEVKARRSFMTNSIDRKTYDPKQLIESETGSASEILENIPSVEVDIDGNVSLRGSQSVRILIDGRPSRFTGDDLADFLQQLPGNSVDKIEVITNPSAKYEPDGMSGIINILLKKNALKGLNGSVTLGYSGKDRANGSLNLNYRIKKVNLFSNYSYRGGTFFGNGMNLRETTTADGLSILDQSNESERARNGQFLKFGADYFIDTKTTLTFQSTLNLREGPRDNLQTTRLLDETDTLLDWFTRQTNSDNNGMGGNFETIFTKKFNKPQQELTLNANYNISDNERENIYIEQSLDLNTGLPLTGNPLNDMDHSETDRKEFRFTADYVHPINKNSKFETGFLTSIRNSENLFEAFSYDYTENTYINNPLQSNDFKYDEQIYAVYGTYANKIKKFGFQLGLRLEQVFTESKQITTNETFENDYFNAYPTVHLSQELNKQQEIMLSYSRRVDRPRERQLNPFVYAIDPLNLRLGNPFLLPEFINAMELGYTKYFKTSSFSASAYFRNINNSISRIKTVDSLGVSTTTYENLLDGNSYGLELVYNGQFGKRFSLNTSFNIFQTKIDGTNLEAELNNDVFGYQARIRTGVKLWKDANLQLSANYRSPRAVAQGEISAFYMVGAGLRQALFDQRLTLSVNTRDLFNTMQFEFETSGENFNQTSSRRWTNRIVSFSVSYRFGELQRSRRNQRGRNNGQGGFDQDGGIEID